MRLDGVKPRSLIFAQFSEGTGIAAAGAGTVSVLRTSTLGEIKQPPLSHLNEKHIGWATTVERRPPQTWFDRDGKLIVHGSLPKGALHDYDFCSLIQPPDLRRRSRGDAGEAEPKTLIDVPHARS
jgi:hypothetical protein